MLLTIANTLFLATLLATSHSLMKWAALRVNESGPQAYIEHWWVVGLALTIYGFLFGYYIWVLRWVPLSTLYPAYTGLSVVLVMLVGVLYFSESAGARAWLGAALIVVGVLLIGTRGQ